MNEPVLPPDDDDRLDVDDDTLPPEHPAGSDAPVSAGEVLSGEGVGATAAGPLDADRGEPTRASAPDDDS